MGKSIIVLSFGGSIIIPDKINIKILSEFRKTILKNTKKFKFVIVCGGGKTARNYINGLENEKINKKEFFQCLLGISVTRLNARFMTYFFGHDANQGMPHDMKDIKNLLIKHNVVFCGGLRYGRNETSDSTAAKLARYFKADFVNLTDIAGLYDKSPKRYSNARFIPEITYKDFYKIARKIKYKPGQHFVLDKKAAKIIKKYKIITYLLGQDMKNLDNLLNRKYFIGTVISEK